MVRLSILLVTWKLMRVGRLALMTPVMTSTDGSLRRHDQVDAGRARLLGEALDEEFDLLAGGHHQIGKLVDDHHDLRQDLVFELLDFVERLAAAGVVAGLDPPSELGALGLRVAHLLVEAGQRADSKVRHHAIAFLHLLDGPLERPDRLATAR